MFGIISNRNKELNAIIEPYFVCENGGYLVEGAPQEAIDALAELRAIGKEEMYDPYI